MPDEKDRLGDRLRDMEKAREDQWAAQHDRELLEQLRRKQTESKEALKVTTETTGSLCPRCHQQLVRQEKGGVTVLVCQAGDGAWIEQSDLDEVLRRLG